VKAFVPCLMPLDRKGVKATGIDERLNTLWQNM